MATIKIVYEFDSYDERREIEDHFAAANKARELDRLEEELRKYRKYRTFFGKDLSKAKAGDVIDALGELFRSE